MSVFALLLIASVTTAEIYVRRNVSPNDIFDTRRAAFHDGGHRVAAFGDSRVNSGVTTSRDIGNFATPGDSSMTVLGKFDTYSRNNPQTRIILQAAPQQFSSQRMNADQRELLADFLDPQPLPLLVLRPHLRRFLLQYVVTAAKNPERLFRTGETPPSVAPPEPATFAALSPETQRAEARQRIQHHTPVASFASARIAGLWRDTLRAAVDRGADLCLVTMPVSAAYRETASLDPAFAAARNFYRDLAVELDVPYVDMWAAWPDDILGNSDHIHARAVDDVTRSILDQCFGPIVARDIS